MFSIFDKFNHDIILYIIEFLNDKDKIIFTSIEKEMNLLKYHVKFYNKYQYDKIKHLSFIKNFKEIQYLSGDTNIPNNITHLTFGFHFDQVIKDRIPNSVTHLTFGCCFNQEINNCIPNSVTHLTFGNCFNQEIKNCIPNSTTHLTFGNHFNRKIKNCISTSVTHLSFGYNFNQEIKDSIPNSVTHLTFYDKKFTKLSESDIPSTVKYLKYINN